MPGPLIVIGAIVAGVSTIMTVHSARKKSKWKDIHDGRLAEVQAVQKEAEELFNQLLSAAQSLGKARVQAVKTLKEAAEFLQATAKQHKMESLPQIPKDLLKEWVDLEGEITESLGIGLAGTAVAGATAAAGPALYAAAGLFGVASTGTRIAGLSGAASSSARLAWLGGGAMAAGGGGVALGSTILNVINVANVVTAPIALGAGIWNEKKAHDVEKKVTAKIEEFAAVECKLLRKMPLIQSSISRASEIEASVQEANSALQKQLGEAEALSLEGVQEPMGLEPEVLTNPDFHEAYRIYLTAKALRELIEQPAISEEQRGIIEE